MTTLAWGARVSTAFRARVLELAEAFGALADLPSWLMAVMYQESGLDPAARNPSGAVGLIQFMPQTAAALGVTTEQLAVMPAVQQLDYVAEYFKPWTRQARTLEDLYGCVLWPGMIGKPDAYVVFDKADPHHPARYLQNKGLDLDADGRITRGEVCARVQAKLALGLRRGNVWQG